MRELREANRLQPGSAAGALMVLEAGGIDVRLVLETLKSHLIGLELNVFQ